MVDGAALKYFEVFDALAGVYLEDSWVLDVRELSGSVVFRLDAVLTPEHELYAPPLTGEQYCYRRGCMTIQSEGPMTLERSERPPAIDASGETDLGSIDTFVPVDWEGRDAWELAGGWGELLVARPSVQVEFD